MGGAFDVNHKLHGAAFAIGVPSLTIAAVVAMWPAHLSWISFLLMAGAMALFFMALSRAGINPSEMSRPLEQLPEGVKAYNGWANRLLFAASYLWLVYTAGVVVASNE
jgi:hypothetical protein